MVLRKATARAQPNSELAFFWKAHLIDKTYPRRHTANPPKEIHRVETLPNWHTKFLLSLRSYPPERYALSLLDGLSAYFGEGEGFFRESTFIDQNNPKRQTAGPHWGSPKLDLWGRRGEIGTLADVDANQTEC